jgi:hypothetical protein
MKKLKQLINNFYRICMVNPTGRKTVIIYKEETGSEPDVLPETRLRQIITDDPLTVEADPGIREILLERVSNNGRPPVPARNSLFDIFLPIFSARHIEIKMAVVSLALFVLVGLGPKNNQASDRKMHLFFLADTLGDTSTFHHPAAQDTAFRVQYK